jgi:urea transporter
MQFWVEKKGVVSILEGKSYIFVWNTSVRGIIIIIFLLTISCMYKKKKKKGR